jgi:uncharacterized protein YqgV (UPF0045/DUF77 family)
MLRLAMFRAEFSIYPFHGGDAPPGYVQAAIDAVRAEGIEVEIGLLGESVTGELQTVLEAVRTAVAAAVAAGATKVVLSLEAVDDVRG